MAKTYDPACYDLAEHFLQGEPCRNDPDLFKRHADDLAKTIQQAVEDWFLSPGDGPQTTLSRPLNEMVDRALKAWFASPPSETDQGLERSMRAAIEAAIHHEQGTKANEPR